MVAFIHRQSIGLVGLLETKVKGANLGKVYENVFQNWSIVVITLEVECSGLEACNFFFEYYSW